MQELPERTIGTDGQLSSRQLPPSGGPVSRVRQHATGLVDDLTSWVDLKVKLVQIDLEERFDAKLNQAMILAAGGLLGLITALFALTTIAIGLGAWLGHPGWGFLIVTAFLAAVTGTVLALKPKLINRQGRRAQVDTERMQPADRQ